MTILDIDKDLTYNELLSKYKQQNRRLSKIINRSDAQIAQLLQLNQRLEDMAYIDSMTGIYNRRYFFENSKKMMSFSKRKKFPLSLAMIDIDNFKRVNDTYGHDIGDEVIKAVTDTTTKTLREDDLFARFGGEEFILMLPNTKLSDAIEIVNRIRKIIDSLNINKNINININITVSIGVIKINLEVETLNEAIKRLDKYLYKAKQNGKNRVEVQN